MPRKPLTDLQRLARIERESAKRRQRIAEYELARGREDIAAMARLSPNRNERARLRRRLAKGTTMPRKNAASSPLPSPAPVKRARKRIKTVKLTGDPFTGIRRALTIEAKRKKRKAAPVHKRATALRNDPAFMAQLAARRPRAIKAAQHEVRMVTGAKRFSKRLMKSEPGLNYPYHKEYRRALARGTTQKLRAPRKRKSA